MGGSEISLVLSTKGVAVAAAALVLVVTWVAARGPLRDDRTSHGILLLAAFGLLIATAETLDVWLGGPVAEGSLFDLRLIVRLAAYAVLLRYAMDSGGRALGRATTVLAGVGVLAVASTLAIDPARAEAVARLLMGLPAALIAGWILWRGALGEPGFSTLPLRLLTGLLVAHGVSEGGAYALAQLLGFAPAVSPTEMGVLGVAVRIASAFLVGSFALLLAVLQHARLSARPDDAGARDRVFMAGIVGLATLVLVVGVTQTINTVNSANESIRQDLAANIETSAFFVRVSTYGDEPIPETAAIGDVAAHLHIVLEKNPWFWHAFVVSVGDEDIELLADAASPNAAGEDPTLCLAQAPDLPEKLRSGEGWLGEPTPELDCVSLAAPLRPLPDGRMLALGVELDAEPWRQRLVAYGAAGGGITALLVMAVLVVGRLGIVRRRGQQRLAESEQRLRVMFESAPGAALLVNPETLGISDANDAACDWLGYSRDEFLGMALSEIEGESAEPLDEVVARALESGVAVSGFREVVTKQGRRRKAEYRVGIVLFGEQRSAIVFARDTTAQRMLEGSLTEQAILQRLLADVATDFVNVTSEKVDEAIQEYLGRIGGRLGASRVTFFRTAAGDKPFEATHQWCAPDVEPLDHMAAFEPDPAGCWLQERVREVDTVLVVGHEDAAVHAPALHRMMDESGCLSFTVVPLSRGEALTGFIGIDSDRPETGWRDEEVWLLRTATDILSTGLGRLKTERDIKRLSRALQQSPVSVLITDAKGDIEWVNPKFEQFNGYSMQEVLGRNPRILKSGMNDPEVYEDLWRTILAGQEWRGELTNQRKDGTLWWVGLTISALYDADGDIAAFVGVQQDITTMKEVQATLEIARTAAEEANRAKSEFLSTMSHEIRTPMNAIIGMSELLAETKLDEDQRRYAKTLESAGDALLSLIDDVLDLSKIEAGRVDLDLAAFEPAHVVEEVADVIAVRVRDKPVEVLAHVTDEVPSAVIGDRHRLRQVLLNLLGNAVKFTEQGHILLDVSRDHAYQPVDRVRLRFEVSDTGIGIPKNRQARIFDSFTQADSSTTREYGGTGLGLAISKRLVELMGGNIGVRSREGKGAVFAFTAVFDIADSASAPMGVPEPDEELSAASVLVVDDNEVNRMIVRDYLARTVGRMDEVKSGEEALEVLRDGKREYDLVLMDVRMPGIDGFEAARLLRESGLGGSPAIVMLTSEDDVGDRTLVSSLELDGRLLKPVRKQALVDAVRRAVASSRSRQPAKEPLVAEKADVSAAEVPPRRILLVEDSQDNRFLVQAFLRDRGDVLDVAENGQEAVEAYEGAGAGVYDLVLMDMQMPIMDGYEATRSIRRMEQERGWPRTPITALTAYALEEEVQKSLAAGCDAHLTKPIRKAQLIEALGTHARR